MTRTSRTRGRIILPLLLGLAVPFVGLAEGETPSASEQVRQLADELNVQSELPEPKFDDPLNIPAPPAALAKVLLYVGIGLGVAALVVIVALMFDRTSGRRRTDVDRQIAEDRAPLPTWAQGDLGDPDQLARSGQYTEAIHALLLVALRKLMRESGQPFSDSLTSREVVRQLGLPTVRKGSMLQLIHASELAWFGGVEADGSQFANCRDIFERVTGGRAA